MGHSIDSNKQLVQDYCSLFQLRAIGDSPEPLSL